MLEIFPYCTKKKYVFNIISFTAIIAFSGLPFFSYTQVLVEVFGYWETLNMEIFTIECSMVKISYQHVNLPLVIWSHLACQWFRSFLFASALRFSRFHLLVLISRDLLVENTQSLQVQQMELLGRNIISKWTCYVWASDVQAALFHRLLYYAIFRKHTDSFNALRKTAFLSLFQRSISRRSAYTMFHEVGLVWIVVVHFYTDW